MNVENKLPVEKVQEIAKSNSTAEAMHKELSARQRDRDFIDIYRFKNNLRQKGYKIVDEEFNGVLKAWESIGAGSVVHGRRGKPTRFEFHFSLKDIGLAATGKGQDIKKLKVVKMPARMKKAIKSSTPVVDVPSCLVLIPFRNDYIEISVPSNLRKEEVEQIANSLKRVAKTG